MGRLEGRPDRAAKKSRFGVFHSPDICHVSMPSFTSIPLQFAEATIGFEPAIVPSLDVVSKAWVAIKDVFSEAQPVATGPIANSYAATAQVGQPAAIRARKGETATEILLFTDGVIARWIGGGVAYPGYAELRAALAMILPALDIESKVCRISYRVLHVEEGAGIRTVIDASRLPTFLEGGREITELAMNYKLVGGDDYRLTAAVAADGLFIGSDGGRFTSGAPALDSLDSLHTTMLNEFPSALTDHAKETWRYQP